ELLARLVVRPDGSSAGRFAGLVSFMWLRQQRPAPNGAPLDLHDDGAEVHRSGTRLDPFRVLFADQAAVLVGRLALGGARYGLRRERESGTRVVWISDQPSRSWARLRPAGSGRGSGWVVEQAGVRRLWDQVEAAHRLWAGAGRPGVGRFGLTVEPDGRHVVWLDQPGRVVAATDPSPADDRAPEPASGDRP
ncbi:MAG: hypothetical protein L0Y54_24335, partial [Sporichthyaceae bacterium]|nr:hypothetical protein [Sporichthyaceae bacterium]